MKPPFAPILSHFNDDAASFLKIRNQKHVHTSTLLLLAPPEVRKTYQDYQAVLAMIDNHRFVLNGGSSNYMKKEPMVSRGAAKVYTLVYDALAKLEGVDELPEKINKLLKNKCQSSYGWFCLWGGRDETTAKLYRDILAKIEPGRNFSSLRVK